MEPLTLIGAGLGSGLQNQLNKWSENRQHNRQKELMDISNKTQEKFMRMQWEQQMKQNEWGLQAGKDMWDYTSYPNQVKKMLEAGLNPALLYGHSGGGGATTGSQSGGQAGGGSAVSGNAMSGIPMDITNLAMMKSQIDVNNATAEKLRAEAEKTSGVDTKLAEIEAMNYQANIDNLVQQTQSEEVKREGYKLNNEYQRLNNIVKAETNEYTIKRAEWEAEEAKQSVENLNILIRKNTAEATDAENQIMRNIQMHNAQIALAYTELKVKELGLTKTEAEIKKMATELEQTWRQLEIQAEGNTISEANMKRLQEAMEKTAWIGLGGQALGGGISLLKNFIPASKAMQIVKGFGG